MIGPERIGRPLVAGVYLTKGEGEYFQWWRYYDGSIWSKGWWIGAQCREWYKHRAWPLNDKERDRRRILYFKEWKPES